MRFAESHMRCIVPPESCLSFMSRKGTQFIHSDGTLFFAHRASSKATKLFQVLTK